MKSLFIHTLFTLSISNSFANCKTEARNVAEEAVRLFNVNDQAIHCMAAGGLKSLKSLPVIMVMPPRYAYEATFTFPCGPQPRAPKVQMLFNQQCKIVNLTMNGHNL